MSNNRFSVLLNDITNKKEQNNKVEKVREKEKKNEQQNKQNIVNSFKSSSFLTSKSFGNRINDDRFIQRNKEEEENRIFLEEKKKKQKEEELKNMLNNTELFPSFNDVKKVNYEPVVKLNYLKKINNSKTNKYELDKNEILPGWVNIKFEKNSRKIEYTYGKIIYDDVEHVEHVDVEDNEFSVLFALAELYEKRKENYIKTWGEDEYENMFCFPNYDYNYFEKLDEKYEKEEKMYEEEKTRIIQIDDN
jgi:hypothetical protein